MFSFEDEELLYEARSFIDRHFKYVASEAVQLMEPEIVRKSIDQIYPGGWEGLRKDRDDSLLRMSKVFATNPEPSLISEWWRLRRVVNGDQSYFFIRPHTEVEMVEIGELECKALVRVAEVELGERRDKIKRRGMRLMVWKRESTSDYWPRHPNEITAWENDAPVAYHKWGRIRTPERVASDEEQVATCFRPGTKKAPQDGPAAKLKMSREEFHGIDDTREVS